MARQSKLLGSPFSSILVHSRPLSLSWPRREYRHLSTHVCQCRCRTHSARCRVGGTPNHSSAHDDWSKVEAPGFSLEPQPASSDSVSPQTLRATSLLRRDRLNGQPPMAAGRFKRITLPLSNRPGSISLDRLGHLLSWPLAIASARLGGLAASTFHCPPQFLWSYGKHMSEDDPSKLPVPDETLRLRIAPRPASSS